MTKIEETIGAILDGIQPQLADSTLEYRREVFGQLTRMADEMGITEPCQKLYDAFSKDDRGSKQRQSMHLLIIKMLDAKAGTQGLTLGGRYINEPKFPNKDEVDTYLASCVFPIADDVDISMLISIAASDMESLKHSLSTSKQYLRAWCDIRTYFCKSGCMVFRNDLAERYMLDIADRKKSGAMKTWEWKLHRKAMSVLKDVAAFGHYHWGKISYRKRFDNQGLEAVRQHFLTQLKEKNLSSATIELRDYVFRSAMAHGNIQSTEQLYDLSYQDIQGIVKSFSGACSVNSLSTVMPIFRGIIRSLCKAGLIRHDHSEIILKPFHQRDNVAGYIAHNDEDRLLRQLDESPLRNRAIVLLGLKLGLRSKDICELRLQDIDWKSELIRLNQHKNGQPLILPLTTEVGNALAAYILDERPVVKDASSKVFLRRQAPYHGISKVYHVCRDIIDNAGIIPINGASKGSHLLRYTLVNRLLKAETPHQVITDTLGHASNDSDKSYISMEADMLRQCAIGLELIGKKVWEEGVTNENT